MPARMTVTSRVTGARSMIGARFFLQFLRRQPAQTVVGAQCHHQHAHVALERPVEAAQPAGRRVAGHAGVHDLVVEAVARRGAAGNQRRKTLAPVAGRGPAVRLSPRNTIARSGATGRACRRRSGAVGRRPDADWRLARRRRAPRRASAATSAGLPHDTTVNDEARPSASGDRNDERRRVVGLPRVSASSTSRVGTWSGAVVAPRTHFGDRRAVEPAVNPVGAEHERIARHQLLLPRLRLHIVARARPRWSARGGADASDRLSAPSARPAPTTATCRRSSAARGCRRGTGRCGCRRR